VPFNNIFDNNRLAGSCGGRVSGGTPETAVETTALPNDDCTDAVKGFNGLSAKVITEIVCEGRRRNSVESVWQAW
jgi:hypothetical protein